MKCHLFLWLIILSSCCFDNSEKPILDSENQNLNYKIAIDSVKRYNVFCSGEDNINTYRIPAIVSTNQATLLAFCEARKVSWRDKSPTDIVIKRSTDGGKTWSEMNKIIYGNDEAYMDPCPIIDYTNNSIYLFATCWPKDDHTGKSTKVFMVASNDDGISWTSPIDMSIKLSAPGCNVVGLGPGSGIQFKGNKYPNRLIIPTRQLNKEGLVRNRAVFSDDNGRTWIVGNESLYGGEYQIAESPYNQLIFNGRKNEGRMISFSSDGGFTWDEPIQDLYLPAPSKGCQGSIIGMDSLLFYSGIMGCTATSDYDERCNLTIWRSLKAVPTLRVWNNEKLLNNRASGYSCMAFLPDNKLALVFENADTPGFIRTQTRDSNWMNIDLFIFPDKIIKKEYWLE